MGTRIFFCRHRIEMSMGCALLSLGTTKPQRRKVSYPRENRSSDYAVLGRSARRRDAVRDLATLSARTAASLLLTLDREVYIYCHATTLDVSQLICSHKCINDIAPDAQTIFKSQNDTPTRACGDMCATTNVLASELQMLAALPPCMRERDPALRLGLWCMHHQATGRRRSAQASNR